MQTLKQAIHLATTGHSRNLRRAATALHGCPVGGWGETDQAWRQIEDLLPGHWDRDYTVETFVAAAYTTDHAQRYTTALHAA